MPLAGMMAPLKVTELVELVNVPDAPAQVVVGAGRVWIVRCAGNVSVKAAWVSAKALAFLKVMVSVDATFSLTVVGKNEVLTVGATGATVRGVGHAVTAVPAEDGALMVAAPCALKVTVP